MGAWRRESEIAPRPRTCGRVRESGEALDETERVTYWFPRSSDLWCACACAVASVWTDVRSTHSGMGTRVLNVVSK